MSKKNIFVFGFLLFSHLSLFSQTAIDITESTLKVASFGEEVFYFGFAEGDQLIFNFEEVNGKELKEVEIMEMPSTSRYMDYKTKKIDQKIINITRTGIYKFRFSNSSLSGRICKFKVQRIPENNLTTKFNCSVYNRRVYDTSYTTVQEQYVVKNDTVITNIVDQVAKVHSTMNENGNRTTLNFSLPAHTVSWSYYIGVDQAGQQVFESAAKELASTSSSVASFSPLAALALGFAPHLSKLQSGEDIDYLIVQGENLNLFLAGQPYRYLKKGKVLNDFSQMQPVGGNLHFCLSNDNAVTGVTVAVKVTAVQVKPTYGLRPKQNMSISYREEMYLKN